MSNVVLGSVLLASNMGHTIIKDVLHGGVRLSSVAAVVLSMRAVNNNLGRKSNR